ncbi:Protein bir1 [Termitomyces sp. J132]|nr:Protein bir1 [Termitomyces sp. J132]
MECLQNRIDSFAKPKRVKNPAKSSSFVSVKWSHPPHPEFIATPETLAEAGFYFNPSFDDRDNVACFVCDKQLAYWEAEDDPFDIHWAKFTFTDKSRVPASKAMERARLATFSAGDGWIHDQVKNHGANSRKMARAGFVFTPQHAGDDLATCLYCNVALSGWEASDDPLEEHRKRQKVSCPMFDDGEFTTKPPSRTPTAKAVSRSRPSRHARAVSASSNTDFTQPMKTHDGDADESDAAPPPSSKRIRTSSNSSKSAKTPKVSRSQSRSELKDVAENDEDVETKEDAPRTTRVKPKKSIGAVNKKAKSRSKSIAQRATSDDEEEVMNKAPSRSRSKAKGKEKATVDDDESEEEIKVPKRSTRGRPPTRVKEQDEDEQEVKALKKSTRGRPPLRVEEPEDEKVEEEQQVKTLKKSTRSRVPPPVEEPDNDDEDLTKTVKKSSRTRTPTHIEGTTARKPSKTRKIKEPEPKPEPETTPASRRDEDDGDPAEPKALLPSETKKRVPSLSVSAKPKALQSKAKGKGKASTPASPPTRAEATDDDDDDDEMDVFVSPRESPEPSTREVPSPKQKDSEVNDEMEPLVIPKRGAKPLSSKPVNESVEMEPTAAAEKTMTGVKPQVPGKETRTARESEMKGRKGSFLKVVEISTDEEGETSDEERPSQPQQKSEPAQTMVSPSIEAPSSSKLNKAIEKPLVIVEPPPQPSVEPPPQPPVEPVPSPEPTLLISSVPTKSPKDVEMADLEPLVETQPVEPVVEVPVPATPPRAAAPPKAPTPEPPLLVLPLSKLPFTPLQSLTDAELDMTVEEWIRYQMEMEYDKFKRDGEREIGRFKKRAEEVKEIIERL